MGHRVTCRSRPPKQDIVNVCFPAGNSITVGIEKIPWVRFGGRLLPQSYVISKASRAGVASGGDIDQKVAPETHYMVFKVAVAAILERKAYLLGASIGGKRRVSEGVIVVPYLHLLVYVKIVAAIQSYHVDVRLLEMVIFACGPREPNVFSCARAAGNPGAESTHLCEPVLVIRSG